MTAFNVVQVRVKPGSPDALGYQRGVLIKTGDHSYCAIAEWDSMEVLAAARPKIASLVATIRDTLETLDGDLGVSDAVSGKVILDSRENRDSRAYAESMA